MHRALEAEATAPPGETMAEQRKLDHFRHEYNDIRPHEAHGLPVSSIVPSNTGP